MNELFGNELTGSFVKFENDEFYKISNVQDMPPFFINLASNSDIWMFLSSNGSLTAGRKSADLAFFPYETDDRIHLNTSTGPKTVIRVLKNNKICLWEPFDNSVADPNQVTRNLYKNIWGNAIAYEEINHTLNLSFQYKWENSEKFGIVRTSSLKNLSEAQVETAVFDGVQNIMPYGIAEGLPSCLADAYKHAELDTETKIAVYSLTSKIVDIPKAVEVLHANVAYSISPGYSAVALSAGQIKKFCEGEDVETETLILGRKCAYFIYQKFLLAPNQSADWTMIMDVCLDQCAVAALQNKILKTDKNTILAEVRADIAECTRQLQAIVASADGMQCTNDSVASKHHFVNVLYNNMRGGIFDDGYFYDYDELISFVKLRNKPLFDSNREFFDNISRQLDINYLKECAYKTGNADLIRVCMEFLPVCFSRRHGDPSRPWNRFFINVKNPDGKRLYHYEGNWRDIFQNWEAMCLSFPEYIENVIAKFVNASTADGFNPYRINTEGIDWEVPEPHNPFSGFGYWGDHQIVYLTRLLEALYEHNPETFERLFENDIFSYANVPYHIKNYAGILENSKDTILFDYGLHNSILESAAKIGSDGKLILKDGRVYHVAFMEKLLVPILAKLSNLIVGGGIWMNTQRPEWNDANNAIVGNGVSMVTVYQLRRHLIFCKKLLSHYNAGNNKTVEISNEVNGFFADIMNVFEKYAGYLDGEIGGAMQKEILDALGCSFSGYREKIYGVGFTGKTSICYEKFEKLFDISLRYIDYTISSNKSNGFYNAYNIVKINNAENTLTISNMSPMLEGQTAVLGSGKLSAEETIELIETMENSSLYSDEQNTFYLYPLKKLKTFMEKNIVPEPKVKASPLINALIQNNNAKLFVKDENGNVRLNANIVEIQAFISVLNELKKDEAYRALVENEFDGLCECYEEIFRHREFTGRSGIMYKYEGIGCIYWHQNAKFLLSVNESFFDAYANGGSDNLPQLKDSYYRLRQGLGFCKSPDVWGAFPLDPYSHTAYLQGAQQPGMTGQVKEEIITRRLELGILIRNGEISFVPALLSMSEFLEAPAKFAYFGLDKQISEITLEKGMLAYTLCQIPVIYKLSDENKISFETQNENIEICSLSLGKKFSRKVFLRDTDIKRIVVNINKSEIV